MVDIFWVTPKESVKKQLKKLPKHIVRKLAVWVDSVERNGLRETQKTPGYHDEPLVGKRFGQWFIRLNRAYRAIYVIKSNGKIEFVEIEEVNKHDY